jgi:hypothetical protein
MKHWYLSGVVLLLVIVCGGALAAFVNRAPSQEMARESLDLLKAMAHRSATAHTYIGACLTAIASAKRLEGRKDVLTASVEQSWDEAAARCRGLASAICEQPAVQAPQEACSRIAISTL